MKKRDFQNAFHLNNCRIRHSIKDNWKTNKQKIQPLSPAHTRSLTLFQIFPCFPLPRYCFGKRVLWKRQPLQVRWNPLYGLSVSILISYVLYQFCFNYIFNTDFEWQFRFHTEILLFPILPTITKRLSSLHYSTLIPSYFSSWHTQKTVNILSTNWLLVTFLFS